MVKLGLVKPGLVEAASEHGHGSRRPVAATDRRARFGTYASSGGHDGG